MAYSTVVTGTTISSSWANADVRDQVVVPFASTGARSSAITAPVTGQVSTLTTNSVAEGIYQYNSAGQWRAPWNLPWGIVANSKTTTAVASSGTTETTLKTSVSFSALSGRQYVVWFDTSLAPNTVADYFELRLRLNSTSGTVLRSKLYSAATNGGYFPTTLFAPFTTSGSTTIVFTATRTNGTGTISTQSGYDHEFLILDQGPSGAPS